jgi:hypothetical protein
MHARTHTQTARTHTRNDAWEDEQCFEEVWCAACTLILRLYYLASIGERE